MKTKILILSLIIASLFGYLEWGGGNHTFLFESEYLVFTKLFSEPGSVLHPFIIFPLIGQVLLIVTIFQKKPNKYFIYSGIGCVALLLSFMVIVGVLAMNWKILVSVLPFFIITWFVIKDFRLAKPLLQG